MRHRCVLLLCVATACSGGREPTGLATVTLNGNHALIAYNGQSLPFLVNEIPATRAGGHTGCFNQIQSGNLSLSVSTGIGRFSEDHSTSNSCTGERGVTYGWSGQVTLVGDTLQLSSTGADGLVFTDVVHFVNGDLVFDKRTPPLTFAGDVTK